MLPILVMHNNIMSTMNKVESYNTMKQLFEDYLKENQFDTEIWIKLTLLGYMLAHDDFQAINYLKIILSYDSTNIYAIMLLTYIEAHLGDINKETFEKLCDIESSDKQIMAMIEFEKIWFYKSDEDVERTLFKSLLYCDKFVNNNLALSRLYLYKGNVIKGQEFLKKALKNVEYIYDEEHPYPDILDIEEFFNESLKGIHISKLNYDDMADCLVSK
jgi:tetratricopeptide (TPR) repeat protein